jgi:glycosyltransferase involved in cell wall biosynthesis
MISMNMLVLNEAEYLAKILAYLKPNVDEMIVLVDDRTTDNSYQIAQAYTDVVAWHTLDMDFGAARNRAIMLSRGQWILQIDADEWPQMQLLKFFRKVDEENKPSVGAVLSIHDNRIDGRPVLGAEKQPHIRFFRKEYRYIGRIHEQPNVPWKKVVNADRSYQILHHKSSERQAMQNARYAEWAEQPR